MSAPAVRFCGSRGLLSRETRGGGTLEQPFVVLFSAFSAFSA
jgi:hypothetical protein